MRFLILSLLCAGSLAAQTPPKVAPCDTAAVLLKAPATFGVGAATVTAACATQASWLTSWAASRDSATRRVVGELLHGVRAAAPITPPAVIPVPTPVPTPQGAQYPNRPSAFTKSSEINFSQRVPSQPDNVDRPIAGTNWNMIYFGANWTPAADSTWVGHWAPGSYGGGVIGQGGGHGIGNVFTYAPSGATRVYLSMRVYFDFDASQWHPISNKFVNIECDHSLILMQLKEGGSWRHAEELSTGSPYTSFFVDKGLSQPGEAHLAGQVDNRAVPNRQWTQIEVLIDLPNHVFKIWQDGVLTTDAAPSFASTRITMVGVYAFRGGGGETLSADLNYKYDHFFVAW